MGLPVDGYSAHRCVVCKAGEPKWSLLRLGDAVVAWACASHLDTVLDMMQRRESGSTQVRVQQPQWES